LRQNASVVLFMALVVTQSFMITAGNDSSHWPIFFILAVMVCGVTVAIFWTLHTMHLRYKIIAPAGTQGVVDGKKFLTTIARARQMAAAASGGVDNQAAVLKNNRL
jgi:hypothetical protein